MNNTVSDCPGIRLKSNVDKILKIWKLRLREELPDAKKVESGPALVDAVPNFLNSLAEILRNSNPTSSLQETALARKERP